MRRCLYIFLFFIPLLFFSFPKYVFAQSESEFLPAGQVIDSDYIRAANQVQIDGEIRGDAFLAGAVVTINGKIDGDLFVAGGKVNINGEVGNSLRVFAGDVTVSGPIGKNALLLCASCVISREATIAGSLLSSGGNLELNAGRIGKGFRFFGSRLYLNSDITNEAFVVADREFLLGPEASISGNLKYTGSKELVIQPGATVAGKISYERQTQDENYPRFFGARPILQLAEKIRPLIDLVGLMVSLVLGFILLGLFPRFFEKVAVAIDRQPFASFGWGMIVSLMVPILVFLFAITIIGIPVSILIVLIFSLLFLAAQYLMAFYIGRKLLLGRFGERRGWALSLGLVVFYFINLIPWVGNLIKLVIFLFAFGAMILAYRHPVLVENQLPKLLGKKTSTRRATNR